MVVSAVSMRISTHTNGTVLQLGMHALSIQPVEFPATDVSGTQPLIMCNCNYMTHEEQDMTSNTVRVTSSVSGNAANKIFMPPKATLVVASRCFFG